MEREIAATRPGEETIYGALTTDREAAEKHDLSRKFIERWRRELDTDPELQARFTEL